MWNDALAWKAIVPLILRVALGVIFIYHGWHKIADKNNEWGAAWAASMREQGDRPPADVVSHMKAYVQMEKEKQDQGQAGESPPVLPPDIVDRMNLAYHRLAETNYMRQNPDLGTVQLRSSVQLLVAWGELVGGVLLLLGLLTRYAALGLVVFQLGAIYLVTWARGFSTPGEAGYEYNIALLAMLLALVFMGSGNLALNRLFWRSGPRPAAAPAPGPTPAPPPAPAPQ